MGAKDAEDAGRAAGFLGRDSEVARLIAAHDWTDSLGPLESWPQSLRTATGTLLASPVAIVMLWGEPGVMIYNDAYSVFAGNRHPSLLGMNVREAWPEVADFNDNVMKVGLAGGTLEYKDRVLRLNRTGVFEDAWLDLYYSPVPDESGHPGGVIAIVIETTGRVLAERRTLQERDRLAQMFEQAPSFIALLSGPEHRFELANPSYTRLVGHRPVIGLTVAAALPDAAAQGYVELLDSVYRSGQAFTASGSRYTVQPTPGGPVVERYVDFVFQPLTDTAGEVTGIFVEGVDVTEGHEAQLRREALAQLSDRLRNLHDVGDIAGTAAELLGRTLGTSRVGYGTIDPEADTLHVEKDWTAEGVGSLAGVTRLRDYGSFIDNLKRDELIVIKDVREDERTAAASEALEARSARSFVNVPIVEQQRLVAVLFVNDAGVRNWSLEELALIREVAERTRTAVERARSEQTLRESEGNFRTLARAMPTHVWTAQPDGNLDWFNEQVYAYSGVEPGTLDGVGWTELVHPDDLTEAAARWGAVLVSGETYEAEFRLRRADGEWRWHIARAVPITGEGGRIVRWIGTNTEIHDQKEIADALADLNATLERRVGERTSQLMEAQDALRQAQKMEAVGQLTGGIAHDFNNLLAGITGSLELLERRLADGKLTGVERYITAAQGAARRAASLTQRLLAFSRRQTLDPRPIDANRLIAGMEDLIRRSVGPDIELEVVGAGGLWTTRVDPGQLEGALLNLCINGRDAMAPNGGRLTIETANKWLDERAAKARELPPGQYISLCVTDTGTGMTAEVMERAFDPFFTTKPLGAGTGLGLSMIYGFVRQSGGQVRIYSEIGKGTTMCLYLPRHTGPAEVRDEDAQPARGDAYTGHGEVVLVIDDEAVVRMLIVDVLKENGYLVLEAEDGPSGLAILQSDARIDLLITDVGLPGGLNGRQVADAARVARPELKVLFVTGYAENAVVGNGHLDHGMEVITKPFGTVALAAKIRDLIDQS